jgi:hypothetical protein
VEHDGGAGARQALGDDRAHARLGAVALGVVEVAQVALDAVLAITLVLPKAVPRELAPSKPVSVPPRITPGLKVRPGSATSLAEGVEDARRLVHGAVAVGAEHRHRMALAALDVEFEAGGGAAADGGGGLAVLASSIAFEAEGDVAALGQFDHVAARDAFRVAGFFLVAGEHDGDIRVLERAHALQRAQRFDR